MRILFSILIAFTSYAVFSQAEPIPVTTKIESVTVFTSGAQINRKGTASLPTGRNKLIFKGLSADLVKESLTLKADGAFTLLAVNHQVNYLNEAERNQEITRLQGDLTNLGNSRKANANQIAVFKQEEGLLLKNQQIGGANTGVKAEDLRAVADFQRMRLSEVYTKLTELETAQMRFDSISNKINQQIKSLQDRREHQTTEVVAEIDAKQAITDAQFDLSYLVTSAGWFLTYDIRVKDVSSNFDLAYKANVSQNCGEAWNNVKLTLSSGTPNESGAAPSLTPWFLPNQNQPYKRQAGPTAGQLGLTEIRGKLIDAQTKEPLIGASIQVTGQTIGTVTDVEGNFTLKVPASANAITFTYTGYQSLELPVGSAKGAIALHQGGAMLEEVVVLGMASDRARFKAAKAGAKQEQAESPVVIETFQPTTQSYLIEIPYTIPSDGKTRLVEVKSESIAAKYQYFAVPKLDKDAFLTAHFTDWQDLNLMPGEASLYFEGAYLGKSLIDPAAIQDTMSISLGRDKNVQIKREKLKTYSKKQFLGNDITQSRVFEFVITNNKRQAIDITLLDQIPVSTQKQLEVIKAEYKGGNLDEQTGQITWNEHIEPRKSTTLKLAYSVKHPRGMGVFLD